MNTTKLLVYLSTWGLVGVLLDRFFPTLPQIIEWRSALFVFGLPWLLCFAGHGTKEVFGSFRDAFHPRVEDLPQDVRARSAGLLRKLGSLSLSAGVLGFFASTVAMGNTIASSGGQGNPVEIVVLFPPTMLAPLFGFLLNSFVYDPLAASLEGLDSGLGSELEN